MPTANDEKFESKPQPRPRSQPQPQPQRQRQRQPQPKHGTQDLEDLEDIPGLSPRNNPHESDSEDEEMIDEQEIDDSVEESERYSTKELNSQKNRYRSQCVK